MVTSVGWGWLAQNQIPSLEGWGLSELPPPAAGLRAGASPLPEPGQVAARVTEMESALLDAHDPRFVSVRDRLAQALLQSPRFSQADTAIHIDLSQQKDAEFIRYLAEEKPGMLTVIYYVQQDGHKRMLVYWPEVTGATLIYTPISGPGVAALSSWLIEKADAPVAQSSGRQR
ncbi:MAG: hypothetical protein D6758_01720 [Gammaproteobacteria bacterium]|nr:MAG: hypothetical protein D6758_01720 [Gammaproteobacteria bacterium]